LRHFILFPVAAVYDRRKYRPANNATLNVFGLWNEAIGRIR
jgi:hypothetical protein